MNLPALVRLSNELRLFLVENDGEITDEMANGLAIVEKDLPAKVDSYKFIIDDMESEVVKWRERADEFTRIYKGYKLFIEKLKENLKFACISMNKTELEGNSYRWKLQNSKSSVIIEDEGLIPVEFKTVVQTIQINKDLIQKSFLEGSQVPGCRLEQNSYVRSYPNNKK